MTNLMTCTEQRGKFPENVLLLNHVDTNDMVLGARESLGLGLGGLLKTWEEHTAFFILSFLQVNLKVDVILGHPFLHPYDSLISS